MIKLTVVKIIGSPNGILYLKKGYDKTLKNISAESKVQWGLHGSVWKSRWSCEQ